MARTGLRMMPTSPSPPLKLRTVGFPQYGYKASLSDGAFQTNPRVEVDSRQTLVASPVCPCPSRTVRSRHLVSSESHLPGRCARRCARGLCRATPGVLGSGASCAVSRHPAYYDPIRQSRGHATISRHCRLYVAPSLCGSASATRETFPTFTAALSTRAIDHTPVGPRRCPVARTRRDARLPRLQNESPPTTSVSASYPRREEHFGAASFALGYGPRVCLALLTGYTQMESRVFHLCF